MKSFEINSSNVSREIPQAFVFGDTSSFHLGSYANYTNFRSELSKKYQIIEELGYRYFSDDIKSQRKYDFFKEKLKRDGLISKIISCDVIVVHAEGLLESRRVSGFR